MALEVGDKAPDFALQSDENKTLHLKDVKGRKIVLYFYPKDNTPGCTREACDFQTHLNQFTKQNALVIGISKDNPERHKKFKEKYSLSFPLLADESGDICVAYGVINKKSLFGRSFLGITRSTFLIDENGMIRAIWKKVKVNGHTQQVLDELNKL